jgi:streptomycin 6-kinase
VIDIQVPPALTASLELYRGEAGRDFAAGLPGRTADFLSRWDLRVDGAPGHGVCALVVPVRRRDGTPAALKLQLPDDETQGEPLALRTWDGVGAVRLLAHDGPTGTLLLERLHAHRPLSAVPDAGTAVLVVARLLARLTAVPAPPGLRRLADLAPALLDRTARALPRVPDPGVRRLLADCAAAVREVAAEPGDRLLHWDLHYDNVLAADRAGWLAIDPKPLAGDPGFELFPALLNRYDPAATTDRFDLLTEALGTDRERARAWTLGRVLQHCLWEVEEGRPPHPVPLEIAGRLRGHRRPAG